MFWLNPKNWLRQPHPLLVENQSFFSMLDQSKAVEDYSYVVLDTELTGLNRKKDEIISIGAVKIEGFTIDLSQTYYQLVRPKQLEANRSTLIHRLSPQELEEAAPLEEVLPRLVRFLGSALIVGHYPQLDMHFINRACWQQLGGELSNPCIDTMRLAQNYLRRSQGYFRTDQGQAQSYQLAELSKQFGLPGFTAHNAFEDAFQTACLFLFLVKKIAGGNRRTLRDLYRAGQSYS